MVEATKQKQPPQKEEVPKDKEKTGLVQMKTGDYMIHVFVMVGKNFKLPGEDTINPFVEVTIPMVGITKYTSAKSGVACQSSFSVGWREHLFFEPRNVHSSQIELDTISIKVKNRSILKDQLIGMYEFDITKVYFEKQHVIHNQWLALFNPESENFSEITGNLKVSISVQGPGDEQVQLSENLMPDDPNQLVMMPAQIKKEYIQLKMRFTEAVGLPTLDTFFNGGTIDPYFVTKIMGKIIRTDKRTAKSVKGHGNVATIDQEFWIPIQWPMATDRLVLQMMDEDTGLNNELVGSMFFSMKNLLEIGGKPGGTMWWQNLYGSPKDEGNILGGISFDKQNSDLMNNNPELGSRWLGRILMQIESVQTAHPERRIQDIDPKIKEAANALKRPKLYDFIIDINMGICLPSNSQKYKVKVQIGDAFEWTSADAKEQKVGYNRWSERMHQIQVQSEYQSIEEMEKVFVYLMDGNVPICYWKGSTSDFVEPNPTYRWLTMKADKALGKVEKDYEAGMIQFKMSIHDSTKNGAFSFVTQPNWKRLPPKRLESKRIRCHIFQCRDIPSADQDGSSDSMISLWNPDGKKVQTEVIEDSLNPIYFQTLEMYYDMDSLDTCPPIVMNLWDRDVQVIGFDRFDFLGRCTVYLQDASTNLNNKKADPRDVDNIVPEPKWHDIKMGFDESLPVCGQVLCSFAVVSQDFNFRIPALKHRLDDLIPYKEYNLEIHVLGLRELQSYGLLPIKKPFIRFRIKSLLPPEKAQAVTNVSTDPNPNGPNPNINTTLTFSVMLPQEELYCPSLGCDVFDFVFSGLSQPLIGTMQIPIGHMKTESEQKRRMIQTTLDEIIKLCQNAVEKDTNQLRQNMKFSSKALNDSQRLSIEEIVVDQKRKDGYSELRDIENQIISEDEGQLIEEKQLMAEDQELIDRLGPAFKAMLSDIKNLELELQQYSEQLVQQGKNPTQEELNNKNVIRKRLAEKMQTFVAEKKKAMLVEKAKDELKFIQDRKSDGCKMVVLPRYEYNEALKIYTEIRHPPSTVFRPVGFNNLELVAQMMDGNDTEKRTGFVGLQRKQTLKRTNEDPGSNKCQTDLSNTERLYQLTNKHYRKYYEDELENNKDLFPSHVFERVDIVRGQSRGLSQSWLSSLWSSQRVDESDEQTNNKVVGYFKGRIDCYNIEEEKQHNVEKKKKVEYIFSMLSTIYSKIYDRDFPFTIKQIRNSQETQMKFAHILKEMNITQGKLIQFINDENYRHVIKHQLQTQTQACIELYVLDCFDLASRDIGSFSDPYIEVHYGDKVQSLREEYILDEPNPQFNKYFEFSGIFPGSAPLVIEIKDYDDLFGDDLIGKTSIDLDDRFFSAAWQALDEKPIEQRQLYHHSTSLSQGCVNCWVEIEESSKVKNKHKTWNITPEPVLDYQVRVCVMETRNIPLEDIEGTSDVFMKVYIDDKNKKTTDTHYRCQNGEASFNYRMLFDLKAPSKVNNHQLVIQAWDFDMLKSNDYICEWVFDLTELLSVVRLTQKPINLTKAYYGAMFKDKMKDLKLEFTDDDSFWITTKGKKDREIKLRLDIRVLPGKEAILQPVGEGRQEPNMLPHLPPPIGRITFSLNPFKMLGQLVNKEYLKKIYGLICVLILAACCIAMAPMILSNIISMLFLKLIGVK